MPSSRLLLREEGATVCDLRAKECVCESVHEMIIFPLQMTLQCCSLEALYKLNSTATWVLFVFETFCWIHVITIHVNVITSKETHFFASLTHNPHRSFISVMLYIFPELFCCYLTLIAVALLASDFLHLLPLIKSKAFSCWERLIAHHYGGRVLEAEGGLFAIKLPTYSDADQSADYFHVMGKNQRRLLLVTLPGVLIITRWKYYLTAAKMIYTQFNGTVS